MPIFNIPCPRLWLVALPVLLAAPVLHAESASETLLRMSAGPDEFYLFDMADVEIMDYKTERDVRICVDARRHAVPLKVKYDGREARVRVGDCFQFEAKRVSIQPAASLESGWDMSGTVETISR